MTDDGRRGREQIRRERRILITNVAIEFRAMSELLGDVQIASGIDDRIKPALIRLNESEAGNDDEERKECEGRSPRAHSRIVSGSTPIFAHHSRYAIGEI